eukprot:s7098_g3.t1
MSKVVLQQADALQLLQLDRGFMMFLKQDARSILPSLLNMSREWRQKKEQGDPTLVSPLRTILLAGLLKEMLQRLQAISATAEGRKSAQAAGWMTEGGDWNYLKWCAKSKRLLTDASKPALQHTEAVRLLNMLYSNMKGDIVLNFYSTQGMQRLEEQGATSAAFKLEISLRGQDATGVHEALVKFINNASTGLIGMSLRREKRDRGPSTAAAGSADVRQLKGMAATSSDAAGHMCQASEDMPCSQPRTPPFRLLNPGNQCYLNAVAYSLWLIASRVHSVLTLPKVLGDNKAGFFKARQLFAYHLLGWRQPERQHDVTELILHLLPKLARPAVTGGVELRQQQPTGLYRRFDSPITQCIVLPAMPKHSEELQTLMHFWHTQDVMHALDVEHTWLLLQLPQFKWIRGRSQKCYKALHLASSLQVPVYANSTDLTVRWVRYHVACYIQHHGPRPDRGHYTVIQMGSARAEEHWLLDDEKDPLRLDAAMLAHAAQNKYVVALINASTALYSSIEPPSEMDWHAAQLFLLEYQLRQIAADMASLNQIYHELHHRVRMLEMKLDRFMHPRGHNKVAAELQIVIFVDELDE